MVAKEFIKGLGSSLDITGTFTAQDYKEWGDGDLESDAKALAGDFIKTSQDVKKAEQTLLNKKKNTVSEKLTYGEVIRQYSIAGVIIIALFSIASIFDKD